MSCSHAAAGRGSWTCQTGGGAAVLWLVHKCMRDAAFFAGPAEVTVLPKPFKLMAIPLFLLPPTVTNTASITHRSRLPRPAARAHCAARVDARGGAAGVVTQYGRNGRSRSRGAEARNALRPGGHPRGRGGAPPAAGGAGARAARRSRAASVYRAVRAGAVRHHDPRPGAGCRPPRSSPRTAPPRARTPDRRTRRSVPPS